MSPIKNLVLLLLMVHCIIQPIITARRVPAFVPQLRHEEAQARAREFLEMLKSHLHDDDGKDEMECGIDQDFARRITFDAREYAHALRHMTKFEEHMLEQRQRRLQEPTTETQGRTLPDNCHYEIAVRFVSNGIFTDSEMDDEIQYMNTVFSGALKNQITFNKEPVIDFPVKFVGRNDVDTSIPSVCDADQRGITLNAVDPDKYLNIMICNTAFIRSTGLAGIGVFPWSSQANTARDVTIVAENSLINRKANSGYNFDSLVSHEAGHSLGLYHTFQNYCTEPNDQCTDTPRCSEASRTCDDSVGACDGMRMAMNPMEVTISHFLFSLILNANQYIYTV